MNRPRNQAPAVAILIGAGLALTLAACAPPESRESLPGTAEGLYAYREGTSPYSERYALAREALEQGRYEAAEEIYRDLIQVEPDSANPLVGLGTSLSLQGRYTEALEAFERALNLAPNSVAAHVGMGSAYHRMGDFPSALEHYRQALNLDDQSIDAHWGAAISLDALGSTNQAREHLAHILELDPNSDWAARARVMIERLPDEDG